MVFAVQANFFRINQLITLPSLSGKTRGCICQITEQHMKYKVTSGNVQPCLVKVRYPVGQGLHSLSLYLFCLHAPVGMVSFHLAVMFLPTSVGLVPLIFLILRTSEKT